ncbi:Na+/H+ antiporter NhaC [Nocardiopsis sp. RSe5-2]|uniref:Na+/H+ antiporter NhaC n=1 Tax=Nocardiopsis endophytica TaxID=3018445 RepID=A0ABT4U2C2_9ACTN|nr:Na+/H+ antiporter NhaC [Nocardiopsis endophytica]MDA2810507.1 Na+/H+ antiporter NhaC [Nocardiopsis endophytica]
MDAPQDKDRGPQAGPPPDDAPAPGTADERPDAAAGTPSGTEPEGAADGSGAPAPGLAASLVPMAAVVAILVGGIGVLQYPAELMLIFAAVVLALFAARQGRGLSTVLADMGEKVKRALPAILILLSIGMLIGTWMIAGTIPLMVAYGLELIDPSYLYVLAFVVTAIVATFTGTSWGAGGTVGVALIGVAQTMDVSVAVTAGAVVSGAYFGDKLSPLSDTTNMSSLAAGADLYEHIRHMLYTSVPSSLVAAAVFLAAGTAIGGAPSDLGAVDATVDELHGLFHLSPVLLIPPAVVLVGSLMRKPPLLVLFASSLSALLLAVAVQGFGPSALFDAAVSGFTADMLGAGAVSDTLTELLERGGLQSMYNSAFFVFCAFFFAAALENSGVLRVLLSRMIARLRTAGGLVSATLLSGFAIINGTSNALVTYFLVNDLYGKAYRRRGLHPVNLSRSMEDSVTITEVLMPWTVSGVFFATTLGVANFDFLPWAVFNWSGAVFSALIAFLAPLTGWFGVRRLGRAAEGRPQGAD